MIDFVIKDSISYGEVSKTYKVTSKNQNYILKVNNLDSYETFLKEKWCIEKCLEKGVNTPKVLEIVKRDNDAVLVLDYAEGINCSEIETGDDKNRVYKFLGVTANKLSEVLPDINISDLKKVEDANKWFYEDYIGYEISQTKRQDDYLDLSIDQRKRILRALENIKNQNFEFCLCHGDLSLKNCLYNENTDKFIILDFGSAETQPKYFFEIMLKWLELNYENSISEDNFKSFCEGLIGKSCPQWLEQNRGIIEDFALAYTLDKYRWAHDKSTKDWQEKYLTRFYKVLELVRK